MDRDRVKRPQGPRQQDVAPRDPPTAARARVLALQRSAGNAAVARLLSQAPSAAVHRAGKRVIATGDIRYDAEALTKVVAVPPPPVTWTGKRPKKVAGDIEATPTEGRGATATPQAYEQSGGGAVRTNRLPGYDGGHVIGLHLGGANVPDNVVPMYPGFNRAAWKNMEDETKRHITAHPARYRMSVTIHYSTAGDEVPRSFGVTREVEEDDGSWTEPLGPERTLTQPDDIVRTAPASADQARMLVSDPVAPVTQDIVTDQFGIPGDQVKDYVNTHGHMPTSRKALFPDDHAKRPYERLDLLTMNGALLSPGVLAAFTDFTAEQRTLILQANMARNGGRLRSDDPRDPVPDLDQRGTVNAPEVDHIVPKSLGGSNYYSNARVISWQLNNREARVKPLVGLVDVGRLALPALGRSATEMAEQIVDQAIARGKVAGKTVEQIVGWAAEAWHETFSSRVSRFVATRLDELVTDGQLTKAGGVYGV